MDLSDTSILEGYHFFHSSNPVKIQSCFSYVKNSPFSAGTLCDTKREKSDIPYPHICFSLILKNSCMSGSIQHL